MVTHITSLCVIFYLRGNLRTFLVFDSVLFDFSFLAAFLNAILAENGLKGNVLPFSPCSSEQKLIIYLSINFGRNLKEQKMRKGLLAAKLLFVAILSITFLVGCSSDPNSIWFFPPPTRTSQNKDIDEYWDREQRRLETQSQERRIREMEWEIQKLKNKGTLFENRY
jgi:hypothetical protein